MRVSEVPVLAASGFYRMTYSEWGDPSCPRVLVCVHGLTRNRRDFDFLAARLADGWRVVCPDIPGRGDSDYLRDKTEYAVPHYAAMCAALIARLDVAELSWLGTSMGGIIGMALAALPQTPLRRLVLNDVGPAIPGAALQRIGAYVGADPRFDTLAAVEAGLRGIMTTFGVTRDAHWRYLAEITAQADGQGRFRLRYDPGIAEVFKASMDDISFWPVWDAIRCPTLLIRGVESDILTAATADEMTRRGPPLSRIEIADCGHAPMLFEDSQIDAVRGWLESGNAG